MEQNEIINIMCSERDGLRWESINMEKSLHRVAYILITATVSFGGLYLSKNLLVAEEIRGILFFILFQIEVVMALFGSLILINILVHSGYLAALDRQINLIAGRNVSIWETSVFVKFLSSQRGLFVWGSTLFGLLLVLPQAYVILSYVRNPFFEGISILEAVITLVVYFLTFVERKRVEDFANRVFRENL